MDETPVWFDMPAARTVESRGVKTVLLKTTGNEKTRFTVVLSCLADGTKLKPMVIFRRKTMPKDKFCPGVLVHVHPRGWMKTVRNCGSRRCGVQDLVVQAIPRASLSGILLALTWVILQSSSWKEIVQLKQSFQGAWRAWCSHLTFV